MGSFPIGEKFLHRSAAVRGPREGPVVEKRAKMWIGEPDFHSEREPKKPENIGQNEVFHKIHRSTTTTSTLYTLQLLFLSYRFAAHKTASGRGIAVRQKRFIDCLIFFNRLLMVSLLSKWVSLCKIKE